MQVENLASLGANAQIEADLVIVGGGPAGLTLAREFFGAPVRVLVVESGELEESPHFSKLNTLESVGEPSTQAQHEMRSWFHAENAAHWSVDEQPFGVRCRVLGGSSKAWAGKSAAFDPIDFAQRPWTPNSGWPFGRDTLEPYLERATKVLNLGPAYGEELWDAMGVEPPEPSPDADLLKSFFWQFARSRLDKMDIMRFGPEFLTFDAPNVRVLLNATVTRIDTDEAGSAFRALEVSTIDGVRSQVRAKVAVLAASGVENPRLLLASNQIHATGLGNRHDVVGRYLMDHPVSRLGRFNASDAVKMSQRFGFYGLQREGRTHMYAHGLAPTEAMQEREQLLNCAVFMLEDRAPDDPWNALKRLMRARSDKPLADIVAVASSPGLLAKGLGMKLFERNVLPARFQGLIVDALVRYYPNFVVREYQSRGLPHKLDGLFMDGITEQPADPESRITLADKRDALGQPMARVSWRIADQSRRTLLRLGGLVTDEFERIGLPTPQLEDWIVNDRPQDSLIIDMGHTLGTTRMSDDPKRGVVNARCQVHDVAGLYVAGGSVFPTSGHANPTMMIVALAIRLADQIKADLAA